MKVNVTACLAGVFLLMTAEMSVAAEVIDLSHQPLSFLQTLQPETVVKELSKKVDFNRTTHTRVYQTYAGYPVWGSDAIFHANAELKMNDMNGIFYRGLKQDLANTPHYVFTAAQATKALKAAVQHTRQRVSEKFTTTDEQTKLVVYVDHLKQAHWAFEVKFKTSRIKGLPAIPITLIDAVTLEVYEYWNDLKTTSSELVDGGGVGGNGRIGRVIYDGLRNNRPVLNITRDPVRKLCFLKNEMVIIKDQRTGRVPTFKCAKRSTAHNNVYWNSKDDAANGAFSPMNDALYSDQVVLDMYVKWLGVPMLVRNGKPWRVTFRVHDQDEKQNAYYNEGEMVFGEGDDESYPIVAPGVVAHEMSHGFTEQQSGLKYRGQSGGINESFSDMADKAVEYFMYGENNWDIDPELLKEGGHMLRYMDEPTKDCRPTNEPGVSCSISHVSDYNSDTNVHFSSGIFNKAFVLMAKKWNTRQAFEVMAQANMYYWTPSATFAHAACGVIKAARDYRYDEKVVRDAMKVVGVSTKTCK